MKIITKKIKYILILIFFLSTNLQAEDKVKIGLLVPLTGNDADVGKSVVKAVRLAINKIGNESIQIILKDTNSNPETTLIKAKEFQQETIKVVIGPIFGKNNLYLNEIKDITFLSLSNKRSPSKVDLDLEYLCVL